MINYLHPSKTDKVWKRLQRHSRSATFANDKADEM